MSGTRSFTTSSVWKISGLAALVLVAGAGTAVALPLCENVPGTVSVCRVNLENRVAVGIEALDLGISVARDATGTRGHLVAALDAFGEARKKLAGPNRPEDEQCAPASKEDERALKEAARGVRDGMSLAASKFISSTAFNAFRTTLPNLTRGMIDAVTLNVDQAEVILGGPNDTREARKRLASAQTAFNKGDLTKASDDAQRAYDRIRGEANIFPACCGMAAASSCGDGNPVPSYAEAPCPNPVYPGIVLGPDFTCGYLTVPENRSKSDGRTIRLAVATRKATAPNPKSDPIVFLSGGPGGSGLAEGPGVAAEWRRDRDVIFLDQRGALQSDPFLKCPEIDAFMARTVGLSWLAPETIEQDAVTTRTCRDRLAAAGADLASYNTTESAADLADLRIAMGIKEWNIYGVSYGSDFALQTLRDHPAGIRTVTVDAVLPPHINVIANGWRAQREVVAALYDACAAQPACHAAFPDGRAEYIQVINALAANPRTVHVAHPTTGEAVTVVIDALKLSYTVQFATLIGHQKYLPSIIHDLAVGDGTQAALEVIASAFPPDFNSYGLLWGVLCREMVGRTDPASVSAAGKRELPDFPASVTERPAMFPWAFSDCAQWDVPAAPSQVVKVVKSDVPVLLTSGSFDGTAIPSYAAEQAATLKNSTNLVFPGIGHSASRWASSCFATIFANFLDQPTNFDYSCLADQKVPPFVTP